MKSSSYALSNDMQYAMSIWNVSESVAWMNVLTFQHAPSSTTNETCDACNESMKALFAGTVLFHLRWGSFIPPAKIITASCRPENGLGAARIEGRRALWLARLRSFASSPHVRRWLSPSPLALVHSGLPDQHACWHFGWQGCKSWRWPINAGVNAGRWSIGKLQGMPTDGQWVQGGSSP